MCTKADESVQEFDCFDLQLVNVLHDKMVLVCEDVVGTPEVDPGNL